MKIWVLQAGEYHYNDVLGVYDSEELAEAAKARWLAEYAVPLSGKYGYLYTPYLRAYEVNRDVTESRWHPVVVIREGNGRTA